MRRRIRRMPVAPTSEQASRRSPAKPRAMPASSTRPLPRTHSRRPPPRAPSPRSPAAAIGKTDNRRKPARSMGMLRHPPPPLMEFPSLRAPHSPDALPTLRRPVRTADPPYSGLVRTLSAIPAASPSPACEATGGERLLRPRRAVPPRPRNRPSQAPYHILHGLVNR